MYFKQIKEIINGARGLEPAKTETRRVCKLGEWCNSDVNTHADPVTVFTVNDCIKWQVGRDYAVSPGRGKPGVWWNPATGECKLPTDTITTNSYPHYVDAVGGVEAGWQPLRIVITALRREPLQAITREGVVAEGINIGEERMTPYVELIWARHRYRELWEQINGRGSWDKPTDVWVITFEVKR